MSACGVLVAKFEESLKTGCGKNIVVAYNLGPGSVHVSLWRQISFIILTASALRTVGGSWCNIRAFESSSSNDSDDSGSAVGIKANPSYDMVQRCSVMYNSHAYGLGRHMRELHYQALPVYGPQILLKRLSLDTIMDIPSRFVPSGRI